MRLGIDPIAACPRGSSFPPYSAAKAKPAYSTSCSGECSRLRYWLCPSLSAHLNEGGLHSLYTLRDTFVPFRLALITDVMNSVKRSNARFRPHQSVEALDVVLSRFIRLAVIEAL